MQIKRIFEFILVQTVISVVQVMPIELCARMCRGLAWLINDVLKFRRKVIFENMSHVYPEWDEAEQHENSREMWYHLLLMSCEIAHAPRRL